MMCGLLAGIIAVGLAADPPTWDANAFRDLDTLDFLTVRPNEGEHWSRVWLVVVDGVVYIRLGSRAADRMQGHSGAPFVKVRIAGHEFDRVRAEPAPEKVTEVAAAIADKYWSDAFIRFIPHPLTMRLVPDQPQ
jgi:hypothetical protein